MTQETENITYKMAEEAMDSILGAETEFRAKIGIDVFESQILPIITSSEEVPDPTPWLNIIKTATREVEVYEPDGNGGFNMAFIVPAMIARPKINVVKTAADSINHIISTAVRQAEIMPKRADKDLSAKMIERFQVDSEESKLAQERWAIIFKRYNLDTTGLTTPESNTNTLDDDEYSAF